MSNNDKKFSDIFGKFGAEDKRDRSESVVTRLIGELYRAHQDGDATRARQIETMLEKYRK